MALAIYACAALGGDSGLCEPSRGAWMGKGRPARRGSPEVAPEPVSTEHAVAAARPLPPPPPRAPSSPAPAPLAAVPRTPAPPPLLAPNEQRAQVPPATVPRAVVPPDAVPPDAVPSDAVPSDAVPSEPVVLWRFRSATSLAGSPAVSPTGLVYLASVEGFLYALGPDGAFRWSYGLTGMPVGAPTVDPAGQVYIATTEQRLYAFKPDGHTSWMQRVGTRFASPPLWAAPGLIYYAGRDRNLYSVAAWGSAPEAHWLGVPANGALGPLADGAVAVGLEGAEAQLFRRALPLARLELAAGADQPLLGGRAHWYAVTGAGLAALDVVTRACAWTAPARRAGLSPDERALVLEQEGVLVWVEPMTGRALHRVQLPAEASASPVVTNSGVALVPLTSGGLLVVEPTGRRSTRVPLGSAPAWPPVWSETSRRATAAAGGDVVGIDLSDWVGPLEGDPADAGEPPEQPSDARRGDVQPSLPGQPLPGQPSGAARAARGGA
ncbi:MAG TPA: PQQ-binding-like beta-propeller repeat protein [Polyangiaceae bacterium]|nr:PQQ-binding-like beta-propeller repeat protein [Polyangiaceae bacterium]